MNKERSHFWIGNFNSEKLFVDFIDENNRYRENLKEEIGISKFAESQNELWLDYDFIEFGYEPSGASFKDKFSHYSYFDSWMLDLELSCENLGINLKNYNALIFINENQVLKPKSIVTDDYGLIYLGVFNYKIDS